MSGEMYAILAYAVGLGLVIAYSLRLCIQNCLLHRREARAGAQAAAGAEPPRPEQPVVVAGLGQVRAAGKVGQHAGHV